MKDMSSHPDLPAMLSRVVDGSITAEEFERLERILLDDPAARAAYHEHMRVHAMLYWRWNQARPESLDGPAILPAQTAISPSCSVDLESDFSNLPVPDLSPLSPSFVGGPVFSYTVASIVLCLMLLSAWAYKINLSQAPDNTAKTNNKNQPVFVARVTGVKECRWANTDYVGNISFSITPGRKFNLESGLLEITYRSGTKVTLEGPCEYTVDSDVSGRLERGKLVARVEKRGERGERTDGLAASAASVKPQAANPQPPAPSPRSPTPLFSVSTPTAIITDLGTEFGVEVTRDGDTISHVFQGVIEVHPVGDNEKRTVLKADQSARVEKVDGIAHLVLGREAGAPPEFVRRIRTLPKQLDILDIVAGGDGTGCRRERGIDPATGKQDTYFMPTQCRFENRYHRVEWNPLIDGVFIPEGRTEPVTLDSAGHTYDDLGQLTEGLTIGPIWARAADVSQFNSKRDSYTYIYTMGRGDEFMPDGRGVLGFHTNKGLTFDLKVMREMHAGSRPSKFKATAGMADASVAYSDRLGKADVWIFVDGRLKWNRRLHQGEKPVVVEVELSPDDVFLTIMGTNAGDGSSGDWLVFGDPVLEITLFDSNDSQEGLPMKK